MTEFGVEVLRDNLKYVIELVNSTNQHVTVTHRGKPVAQIVPARTVQRLPEYRRLALEKRAAAQSKPVDA